MDTLDNKFDTAIKVVLAHEGGYVNNIHDAGGETNFGISKRSYPDVDIANLTIAEAKSIYKRDFWDNQPYKRIVDSDLCTKIFDSSVNMGPSQANKLMQKALNAVGQSVVVDGALGSKSIDAINCADPQNLLIAFKEQLEDFYLNLVSMKPTNSQFLRGWLKRANE